MIQRSLTLFCLLALAACVPLRSEPGGRAGAPAYPALLPLGPVEQRVDVLLLRDAASAGASLEARGADLRQRAMVLREMPL